MGVSDDWSYIRTVQLLAQTGHIHYNGWATAMIGWQLYLGAACVKLFGFSFTAARLPTLIIALTTAYLMQRTLVRFGISERNAVLGTLTFVLSPLFMMLSATMMTDVPGFFSILACIYACLRALQALRDRDAILWICAAVALNALCGTSRQIAWLGVLVLVPSTLFLLRSRRRVLLYGIPATALGYTFVFSTLHWFNAQPYAVPERFSLRLQSDSSLTIMIGQYDRAILTAALLLLPVIAPFLAELRHWSRRSFLLAAGIASAVGLLFFSIRHADSIKLLLSPFVGDWLGLRGSYNGVFLNQQLPPVLIGHALHTLLGLTTAISLLCLVVTLFSSPRPELPETPPEPLTQRQLLWLLGPFSLVYALLLLDRAQQILFDRYTLAPIFVLLLVTLRFYQRRIRLSLPAASIAMLCLLAGWGIICTHNLFALDRARVVLDNQVLSTGISPNAVDFGWDQNGWVALQQAPGVNDSRIVNPPNTHIPIRDPHLPFCYGQSTSFGLFPRLAPQFGVAYDPNACAGLAPFAPVSYISWLSMQPVYLYVVKYPPPWRPESDYTVPSPAPSVP
jgi:hypothetical protein